MIQKCYILPEKLESWLGHNGFPGGPWLQPCRLIHYGPQHCSYWWLHLKHCKMNGIHFLDTKHIRSVTLCFSVQYEAGKYWGYFLHIKSKYYCKEVYYSYNFILSYFLSLSYVTLVSNDFINVAEHICNWNFWLEISFFVWSVLNTFHGYLVKLLWIFCGYGWRKVVCEIVYRAYMIMRSVWLFSFQAETPWALKKQDISQWHLLKSPTFPRKWK